MKNKKRRGCYADCTSRDIKTSLYFLDDKGAGLIPLPLSGNRLLSFFTENVIHASPLPLSSEVVGSQGRIRKRSIQTENTEASVRTLYTCTSDSRPLPRHESSSASVIRVTEGGYFITGV